MGTFQNVQITFKSNKYNILKKAFMNVQIILYVSEKKKRFMYNIFNVLVLIFWEQDNFERTFVHIFEKTFPERYLKFSEGSLLAGI